MKGWRTFLLGAVTFVIGVLELYTPGMWSTLVPAKYQPYVVVGIGLAIFVLRYFTSTPPGKKAP